MATPKNKNVIEYVRCKNNFLYFLFNYIKIPEIGGARQYTPEMLNPKFKQTIATVLKIGHGNLMATRQLGKSTISAALLEYCMNFFPGNRGIILNMQKTAALENLSKVKFMHDNLPEFLKSPLRYKGDRKTYLEYMNGSILRVFYPSSTTPAEQLARSLSSPILYVDECAFISHIDEAYASAQPTLSKAREQAKKSGYPSFILLSSTPNGTAGTGQFYYDMWQRGIDSELIFDDDNNLIPGYEKIVNDPTNNGFINVKYHWSEDPTKDADWYSKQKRELNFKTRKINQELDLIFTGSSNCIFDDEFLGGLKAIRPILSVPVPHFQKLHYYTVLDPNNFYLVGIDTAKSLTGDFACIEVYDFIKFEQVAEFSARLGSLTKFAEIVKYIIRLLCSEVGNKLLVGIESNSAGAAIIESLENDEDPTINYSEYLYHMDPKKSNGIVTSSTSKDRMISVFYDNIHEHPELLHSSQLITQLSSIEKKPNGSISAQGSHKDDLMMGSCFCAYMRKYEAMEIEPKINVTPSTYAANKDRFITNITAFANIKNDHRQDKSPPIFADIDIYNFNNNAEEEEYDNNDKFDMSSFF